MYRILIIFLSLGGKFNLHYTRDSVWPQLYNLAGLPRSGDTANVYIYI